MKAVAKANPSGTYSYNGASMTYDAMNTTLRNELNEIAGTYNPYRENKNLVFTLMEETMDDILPARVLDRYGMFAEVQTFAQGDKPVFTRRVGHMRAKQFITRVGLAGRYEVFKLDGRSYEVTTSAYGASCQIAIEEFLDGRVDFATLLDVVMEGLDDKIYMEIAKALIGTVETLQGANKYSGAGFVEEEMDRLIQVADSYGSGRSTIYCTFEFASQMIPANEWISDGIKDEMWRNGYLANYKNHQVIVLRQSFTDETNTTKVIDPSYAWIIPGGAEKPIKIAFEGDTLMKEIESQDDWSRDLQFYKKIGVAAIVYNDICVYRNESLSI